MAGEHAARTAQEHWKSPYRLRVHRSKKHTNIWVLVAALLLMAAIAFSLFWWLTRPTLSFRQGDPSLEGGDPAKGRLVFTAGLCNACHATPGQDDPMKLGGGLALASPFGTFRVPNISSDPVEGIGAWSAADLANALVDGVSPKGQHYYPAFPYVGYTGMHVEDIRDLYAYLRTLPAAHGKPPPHDLPLIFRIRRMIGIWKLLYFRPGMTQAQMSTDTLVTRGSYLAEVMSHCAECHSSRNLFGAIKPSTRFAGGIDPEGTGFVPNITAQRLSQWSENDIAAMLKSGQTPDHGTVGSSMADVVSNLAALPESDRRAIAHYVKTLPARPTTNP